MYPILLLTPSQESDQAEIELKDDNPHAVEGVLRYIYSCRMEAWALRSWEYWLDLAETADKYLEPKLSEYANACFIVKAVSLKDSDVETICEILQTIQDTDKYAQHRKFAVDLTMRNLRLLKNEQLRAQVYSCKWIMFKIVELLSFAADLVPEKVDCAHHGPQEFYRKR